MKEKALLEKIFVSQDNKDIRSKIKSLIGYDVPSIVEAWASFVGYDTLYNKDITELLLTSNVLDDEFAKFLQSLQAIKSTTNRISKKDFISLFKELIANTGYMSSTIPYLEDILNYLGYAIYLTSLSGLDVKVFSFMLLKAKHQQTIYKNPQNQQEQINQIEYTAHVRIKGIKVKKLVKPSASPASKPDMSWNKDAFGRFT